MVSKDIYTQIKDVLNKAERILVCINNRSSFDTHLAAAAMVLHMGELGKNVTVCINGELISRHRQVFDEFGIEYEEELKPLNYVITIDHSGSDIEKVSYDDKDGKFRLYITPSSDSKVFDFDKVSYSQGGGSIDAVFVFGARSLRWLGDIHKENKDLFENAPVVNINNLPGVQEFGTAQLVDSEVSVSEVVYELMDGSTSLSNSTISNLLLMGVLEKLQPLQINDYKISNIEVLTNLVRIGADLKEAMKRLYFDRTLPNFEVERRVMGNAKFDADVGLIWSTVSAFDLSQAGVDRDDFVLDGRIVFNICREFKVAMVLYEVQEGEIVVELESNTVSLDAKELLSGYKVSGNSARVFFTVRNKTLPELEQEMLEALIPKVQGVGRIVRSDAAAAKSEDNGERREGKKDVKSVSRGDFSEAGDQKIPEEKDSGRVTPIEVSPDRDTGLVEPPPISSNDE